MACSLVISSASGTKTGGILTSIQVTGTVSGCNQVEVTIQCLGTKVVRPATITGGTSWSVVFNSTDINQAVCNCGRGIQVIARCANDPACPPVSTNIPQLNCSDCCDVDIQTTIGEQCDNGKRLVIFHIDNKCGAALTSTLNFDDGSPVKNLTLNSGPNTVSHMYLPGSYNPTLLIPPCPEKIINLEIESCPACCEVELSEEVGSNCVNGKRVVTLEILNRCPGIVNGQIDFGDASLLLSVSLTPVLNTVTHTYAPGNYTVVLKIDNCPEKSISFVVPPCCCPKIETSVQVGDCNVAGNTQVCLVTTVDVPAGCKVTMQWNFGDGQSGGSHTFLAGSNTFTECHDYAPGSYSAQLNIVSPSGCRSSSVTVNVPHCDCCPTISVTPCIEDCVKGQRVVTFDVVVNAKPAPCPPVEVQLDFGDENTGGTHSYPPGGSGSYTETHVYSGNSALQDNTASLNVIQPQGCPGWSTIIPACCKKKLVNWCTLLFTTMTLTLALALGFSLGNWLCSLNIQNSVIFGLLGLFVVALLIYLILKCPKCRCGWLYLLLWRVLSAVGLLFAIFAGCQNCNKPWTFWVGLGLLILAFVPLLLWKKACCVKLCRFLKEIVLWIGATLLPLAGTILAYAGQGCLYILFHIPWGQPPGIPVYFYAVVLFLWSFVLTYYLNTCSKESLREGR